MTVVTNKAMYLVSTVWNSSIYIHLCTCRLVRKYACNQRNKYACKWRRKYKNCVYCTNIHLDTRVYPCTQCRYM